MKTDFLGNELNIGDKVVFMEIKYRNLLKGTIVKLTNKKAVIQHDNVKTFKRESIQFFTQIIKIEEN